MHRQRISLIGTATVGTKGQIVIPAEAREFLGIGPGDKVFIVTVNGKKALGICPEATMQKLIDKMGHELDALKTFVNNNKE